MMTKLAILWLVPLLLGGCASSSSTTAYQDRIATWTKVQRQRLAPATGAPVIRPTDVAHEASDAVLFFEQGFWPIGYACFDPTKIKTEALVKQAGKVGAWAILLRQEKSPVDVWTNYSGLAGTNEVTSAQTLSMSSNFVAGFWGKLTLSVFGAVMTPVPAAVFKAGSPVQGAFIKAVIRNGAAYRARLQRGDIITHLDGATVEDGQDCLEAMQEKAGGTVNLTVVRRREVLQIPVKLDSNPGQSPRPALRSSAATAP